MRGSSSGHSNLQVKKSKGLWFKKSVKVYMQNIGLQPSVPACGSGPLLHGFLNWSKRASPFWPTKSLKKISVINTENNSPKGMQASLLLNWENRTVIK